MADHNHMMTHSPENLSKPIVKDLEIGHKFWYQRPQVLICPKCGEEMMLIGGGSHDQETWVCPFEIEKGVRCNCTVDLEVVHVVRGKEVVPVQCEVKFIY